MGRAMRWIHWGSAPVLLLVVLLCSPTVWAKGSVLAVTDLFGDPEVRDEAIAISLVIQSALDDVAIPRRRLAEAITKVAGKAARYALVVESNKRRELRDELGADVLLWGTVQRRGTQLTAALHASAQDGPDRLLGSASLSTGRLVELGFALAQMAAKAFDLSAPAVVSSMGYGQVYPYVVAAKAHLAGKPTRAASALVTADARAAGSLSALREVALQGATAVTLGLEDRLLCALAAEDGQRALELARRMSEAASDSASRDVARGGQALAQLALDDLGAASRVLRGVGSDPPALVLLAKAGVADGQGRSAKRDALLRRLIRRRSVSALVVVAQLPPEITSARVLRAALKLASGLSRSYAPLKTVIGVRAASRASKLKLALGPILPLIDVDLVPPELLGSVATIADRAIAQGLAEGYRLRAALRLRDKQLAAAQSDLSLAIQSGSATGATRLMLARTLVEQGRAREALEHYAHATARSESTVPLEYARALDLAGDTAQGQALRKRALDDPVVAEARAIRVDLDRASEVAGIDGATALEMDRAQLEELCLSLGGLVRAFKPLGSGQLRTIGVAALKAGGDSPVWPFRVHSRWLARGLRKTLGQRPYELVVVDSTQTVNELSTPRLDAVLKTLAVDALMVYDVTSTLRGGARVHLVLYDPSSGDALQYGGVLGGSRTGLVSWNRLFLNVMLGLFVVVALLVGYRLVRGTGEITVTIDLDPGTDKPAYTVLVSRSPKPQRIADADKYTERVVSGGMRNTRMSAVGVHNRARFRSVPAGKCYVHLFGTHIKQGERQILPPSLVEEVQVGRGKLSRVAFDLEPTACLLRLKVFDENTPVKGAKVWLGDDQQDPKHTDRLGGVVLSIPRHQNQEISIETGAMLIRRSVQFDDTKAHDLTVNLVKERRMRDLAHGIALDDEALSQPATNAEAPIVGEIDLAGAPTAGVRGAEPTEVSAAPQACVPTRPQVGTVALGATKPAGRAGLGQQQSAPSPQSGLSRYRPLNELGRGAMGVVYQARDLVLERDVALKVMSSELRRHPMALKMFSQEAKALAALNHQNVVMVFDQGHDGGDAYMVMELVEGQTLDSVIEQGGALPLDKGLEVADQLCAGLAYAHSRQIIHRDIKPDNVFISADGVVKIGDFGLARVMRELSIQKTEVRGTPLYMAPEQIRGKDIDFRADIYSLGCTFFAMFTGRPPFVDGEILYHHLHTEPPSPSAVAPSLPTALDEAIFGCMAKDKGDRLPSVDALRHKIGEIRTDLLQHRARA